MVTRIWEEINRDWIEKLSLVYSWMPRIAGKDFKLKVNPNESLEASIQRHCKEELLKLVFNIKK